MFTSNTNKYEEFNPKEICHRNKIYTQTPAKKTQKIYPNPKLNHIKKNQQNKRKFVFLYQKNYTTKKNKVAIFFFCSLSFGRGFLMTHQYD